MTTAKSRKRQSGTAGVALEISRGCEAEGGRVLPGG